MNTDKHVVEIEEIARWNVFFRRVVYTSEKKPGSQITVMCLRPLEHIGGETHHDAEQIVYIVSGEGTALIGKRETKVKDGTIFVIPQGTWHDVTNDSKEKTLKFFVIYSKPQHPREGIDRVNPEKPSHSLAISVAARPAVWITVPHARCPEVVKGHDCDFGAERAAVALSGSLVERFTVTMFLGDVPRDRCDLNRSECRYTTDFRERLRTAAEHHGHPRMLLDVHSYPPGGGGGPYSSYDIVILDERDHGPSRDFGEWLYRALKGAGINVGYIQGESNDVQKEQHQFGVTAMLLEFNEANSIDLERRICQLISKATEVFLRDRNAYVVY